eukprot:6182910-Pleurochrysis_carterae.AAC.2
MSRLTLLQGATFSDLDESSSTIASVPISVALVAHSFAAVFLTNAEPAQRLSGRATGCAFAAAPTADPKTRKQILDDDLDSRDYLAVAPQGRTRSDSVVKTYLLRPRTPGWAGVYRLI